MLQAREEEQQQLLRFLAEWHDGSEARMVSQGTQLSCLERRICNDIVADIDCLARDSIRREEMDAMYERCKRLEADMMSSTGRAIESAIAGVLEKSQATSRAMVAKSDESIDSLRSHVMQGINDFSRGLNDVSNLVHSNVQACDALGVRLDELTTRLEKVESASDASEQEIQALWPVLDRVRDKLSQMEDEVWAEFNKAEAAQNAASQREIQRSEADASHREELAQIVAATDRMETQLATSEQQLDHLLNSRLREAEERLLTSHGELCSQVADAKQELKAGLAKNEAEIQTFAAGFNLVSDSERTKSATMVGAPALGPLSPAHETASAPQSMSVQTPSVSAMKLNSGTDCPGCPEVWSPHSTNGTHGDSLVLPSQKQVRQARVLSGSPMVARPVPVRNANSPSSCTSPGHQRMTPKGVSSPKALTLQSSGCNKASLGHSSSATTMMSRATVLGSMDATPPQNARSQLSPKGATPLSVTRHAYANTDLDVTMPSTVERRSVSPPTICVQARQSLGDLSSAKTMPND